MKNITLTALAFFGILNCFAQSPKLGGFGTYEAPKSECVPPQERVRINQMLQENIEQLKAEGKLPKEWGTVTDDKQRPTAGNFIWPLQSTEGFNYNYGVSNYVDLDPLHPDHLLDWNCGARTYDLASGNHQGIDIFTWPFGQHLQEYALAKIVAAADGVIIGKDDGSTDHSCSMNVNTPWNAVYIGNTDGTICWYGHMKKNSTTSKQVGQSVSAGEVLGVVGSSGMSTGPHLHFETHASNNSTILEPFSGPCNTSASLWADQKPYHESKLNLILTHNHAPIFPNCPGIESINAKDTFTIGDSLIFASYYHDQTDINPTTFTIYKPDNSVFSTWDFTSNAPYYAGSYFYWFWTYSTAWVNGKYTFEAIYEGDTLRHKFWVYDQIPSSIDQINKNKDAFTIYPNPNSGSFDIKLNKAFQNNASILKITDITGFQLYEQALSKNEEFIKVKLSLAPGIYFLSINGKDGKVVQSFVVQ